jgi:hypothetical protein
VSAEETIEELSKLSANERAAVRRRLRELGEQDEVLFLHGPADALFYETDKTEEKNGRLW